MLASIEQKLDRILFRNQNPGLVVRWLTRYGSVPSGPRRRTHLGPTEIALGIADELALRELRWKYCEEIADKPACWWMVLDLFKSMVEGKSVSISSACIASDVPPTTALRYVAMLEEWGWTTRESDSFDKRRAFLKLTMKGRRSVEDYIRAREVYLRTGTM